jgi:uncharacterized protein
MSFPPGNSALIIFAREPQLGRVKTRLKDNLPSLKIQQLYKAFIQDVCRMAGTIPCPRFLFYTGAGTRDAVPFLSRFKKKFLLRRQSGRNLGRRMLGAFEFGAKEGYGQTVIIGTDCLTLSAKDVTRAFKTLARYDCVLGPAKDGGYYLIGLRRPNPELFTGVRWGSADVLRETIGRLQKCGLSFHLLPVKEDIDTYASLIRFYRSARSKTTLSSKSSYVILQKLFRGKKASYGPKK